MSKDYIPGETEVLDKVDARSYIRWTLKEAGREKEIGEHIAYFNHLTGPDGGFGHIQASMMTFAHFRRG